MSLNSKHLAALTDLAVLHFSGADAVSFLQSQLTNAVDDLQPDQAVLAGFCQAKGRLQASLVVWPDPQDNAARYVLIKRAIAETVQKRLKMFVLRAKVTIQLLPAQVYGLTQAPMQAFTLPTRHFPIQHHSDYSLLGAPCATADSASRAWLIADESLNLEAHAAASDWQAADIYAGLPWVDEHNYEVFLPQDINLDIVGGVNFKKGCFPGQEVVARLHYRTTARRRAALGVIRVANDIALQAGQDVFSQNNPERALGRLINCAYDTHQQHYAVLMEVLIEDLAQQELFVLDATTAQQSIEQLALPYGWEIAKY